MSPGVQVHRKRSTFRIPVQLNNTTNPLNTRISTKLELDAAQIKALIKPELTYQAHSFCSGAQGRLCLADSKPPCPIYVMCLPCPKYNWAAFSFSVCLIHSLIEIWRVHMQICLERKLIQNGKNIAGFFQLHFFLMDLKSIKNKFEVKRCSLKVKI